MYHPQWSLKIVSHAGKGAPYLAILYLEAKGKGLLPGAEQCGFRPGRSTTEMIFCGPQVAGNWAECHALRASYLVCRSPEGLLTTLSTAPFCGKYSLAGDVGPKPKRPIAAKSGPKAFPTVIEFRRKIESNHINTYCIIKWCLWERPFSHRQHTGTC